jgi:hypothetical protein
MCPRQPSEPSEGDERGRDRGQLPSPGRRGWGGHHGDLVEHHRGILDEHPVRVRRIGRELDDAHPRVPECRLVGPVLGQRPARIDRLPREMR